MSSELLAGAAGVLMSLIASYVPGVREWFAALDASRKRLVMLGALAAVAIGATALSCAGVLSVVECSQGGVIALATNFLAALVANQSTYLVSPKKQE